jgi:tetratricopeptide (TPR) repeat protein
MSELETHIDEARKYLEQENYIQASASYMKSLESTEDLKDKAIIWAELSWAYYRMNEFERTIEAAENTLKLDPDYEAKEDVFRIQGFAYIGLNKDEKAINCLNQSLDIDRNSSKQQITLYELAKIYFKLEDYEKAFPIFEEIESYFYQNQQDYWLSILFYKGFIQYHRSNYSESEINFEELLENSKDGVRKATALFGLAFVAFSRKDYLKTINLCESLVKNDENFFDMETVGFLTAASFYYLGRQDVFDKYYTRLKKNFPNGRYAAELNLLKENMTTAKHKN